MTSMRSTPFDIVRAAHVELVVTDLDASRLFYVERLGLTVTEETSDALYLRAFEERLHHSLVLRRGPEPALGHLGYRVASPDDLAALERFYDDRGCSHRWVTEDEETGQGPGAALRVLDPLGFQVEFFHDMRKVECLLQRFELHRGAMPMRLEHLNLLVPDAAVACALYEELGFRCSEVIESAVDGRLCAAWMYRKPTVHDVAFTGGLGPRLHHVAYATADAAAILRVCDILGATEGHAIERGPGRHGVSNAFFLYLRDPDGHRVELYVGDYYTGDPDHETIRWSNADPRRRTFWGHAVPDSWFDEGSRVLQPDGSFAALEEPVVDERVVAAH